MPEYGEIRVDYITYTTGTSPNEGQGTVTVSGLINNPTFSGNVIVGNDLTVSGTLNANDMTVTGTVVISGTMSGESMTFSTGIFASGAASTPSITFIDDLDTGIYAPAANEVAISTSGTGRVFIDDSGNVGIGTSSPGARLEVSEAGATDGILLKLDNVLNTAGAEAGLSILQNSTDQLQCNLLTERKGLNAGVDFKIELSDSVGTIQEILRISEDGNLGINTNSPQHALDVESPNSNTNETVGAFGNQTIQGGLEIITNGNLDWGFNAKNSRSLVFETNQIERFRVDSNGKVLIGRSTAGAIGGISPLFQVADNSVDAGFSFSRFTTNSNGPAIVLGKAKAATVDTFTAVQNNDELGKILFAGADGTDLNSLGGQIIFSVNGTVASNSIPTRFQLGLTKEGDTSPTNRMRLEADGECKYLVDSGSAFEIRRGGTSATQAAFSLYNNSSGFNGGTLAFTVRGDGDCENTNNQYGAISDAKLKENIADASSQWDDIKAIRVRKYNFKSETGYSTHTQIGVIAQELETISPGLIGETKDRDGEGNDLGTVTKSVSYSVMYMKAVKALQEAMERIEILEQRLSDAGL